MSTQNVEKFFSEVPNSAAGPINEKNQVPVEYDEIINCIDNIYKKLDYKSVTSYKAGKVCGRKKNLETGLEVLNIVISCYITELRNNNRDINSNTEELHETSLAIANFEKAVKSVLSLSENLNLNVDVNSVLAIIHGAVTELSKEKLKNDR